MRLIRLDVSWWIWFEGLDGWIVEYLQSLVEMENGMNLWWLHTISSRFVVGTPSRHGEANSFEWEPEECAGYKGPEMTAPSMADMNKVGLNGKSHSYRIYRMYENLRNQVIMISTNQPMTKKSKSHYRVFLFQRKVLGKGKHTTSPEFKSDNICFKSNLTSWWIQIAKPGKMFFLPWKEIEEKVIKRTLEDSWYSVGNICLDTKWQYQRTVGCGGNCCFS